MTPTIACNLSNFGLSDSFRKCAVPRGVYPMHREKRRFISFRYREREIGQASMLW